MDLDLFAKDYAAFKKRLEPMVAAWEAEHGKGLKAADEELQRQIHAPLRDASEPQEQGAGEPRQPKGKKG